MTGALSAVPAWLGLKAPALAFLNARPSQSRQPGLGSGLAQPRPWLLYVKWFFSGQYMKTLRWWTPLQVLPTPLQLSCPALHCYCCSALIALIILIAITHVCSHSTCIRRKIEGTQSVSLAIVLQRRLSDMEGGWKRWCELYVEMVLYNNADVSRKVSVEFGMTVGLFLYINGYQ